jgi:hypothetical protein
LEKYGFSNSFFSTSFQLSCILTSDILSFISEIMTIFVNEGMYNTRSF